jgi:hypothetical protein
MADLRTVTASCRRFEVTVAKVDANMTVAVGNGVDVHLVPCWRQDRDRPDAPILTTAGMATSLMASIHGEQSRSAFGGG